MKANELMIGDWIAYPPKTPQKVTAISASINDKGETEYEFFNDVEWYPVRKARPIPLTPEILEKNGFRKCDDDERDGAIQMEYGDKDLGVDVWVKTTPCLLGAWRRWEGEEKVYDMISELPINYVHELQHALRLCGIEKEIVL